MENLSLININKAFNQLSPKKEIRGQCGKIIPGKFTFLNSNQLITKYVDKGNVSKNPLTELENKSKINAYDNCKNQTDGYKEWTTQKIGKENEIINKIKYNSQKMHIQMDNKQKQMIAKTKQIQMMVQNVQTKAADIMYGRNNSTFMRKQTNKNETPLKQMRQHTSSKSLKKIEATRVCMVNKSHKYIQDAIVRYDTSIANLTFNQQSSNNSSFLTASSISNQNNKTPDKLKNQNFLLNLLKNKNFEEVYQIKRRNATSQAFAACWQLGANNKKIHRTKFFQIADKTLKNESKFKKRKQRKTQIIISELQKLKMQQNCMFKINKKYYENFKNEIEDFRLVQKC